MGKLEILLHVENSRRRMATLISNKEELNSNIYNEWYMYWKNKPFVCWFKFPFGVLFSWLALPENNIVVYKAHFDISFRYLSI